MRGNRHLVAAGLAAVLALAVGFAIALPKVGPLALLGTRRPAAAGAHAGPASARPAARAPSVPAPMLGALALTGGAQGAVAAAAASAGAGSGTGAGGAAASAGAAPDLGDAVVRRVEQDAVVTVRVKNVASAFNQATALDSAAGGYVDSSSMASGGGPAAASLVLAVPQPDLASFLQQLDALGTVLSTQVTGQDVTNQYVDLQGSLQALEAERQSYLTLLGRATAIGDILEIQEQITDVETQIEDLQGQVNEIDDLSAMAQVTLTLQPPAAAPRPVPAPTALGRVAAALRASVAGVASGATDLALALAWVLPWAVLGGAGYAVYRRVTRVRT